MGGSRPRSWQERRPASMWAPLRSTIRRSDYTIRRWPTRIMRPATRYRSLRIGLSYIFDLHGPSLTIDTACSSSLVALHEARHALARGEVDAALVGGVNILSSPFGFISFSQATMLSPTGLCRAFAEEADGYVRAEGGVVLVLKTLKKAIEDGDRIHAVICGSGVNSDGRTSGISLPDEEYQTNLLRAVYRQSGVSPESLAYVEAHGTGTRVGDPVEASALGKALGRFRARPLPVGSIKTNIGHTEPASGLAGLVKAMLVLEHDEAPPSLHFDKPNPNIDFAGLNLARHRADDVAAARRSASLCGRKLIWLRRNQRACGYRRSASCS